MGEGAVVVPIRGADPCEIRKEQRGQDQDHRAVEQLSNVLSFLSGRTDSYGIQPMQTDYNIGG